MKHSKFRIFKFRIWVFSTIFCTIEIDLSGTPPVSGFQKLAKLTNFGIINELLTTSNVNVARFARNLECT